MVIPTKDIRMVDTYTYLNALTKNSQRQKPVVAGQLYSNYITPK